MKEKIIEAMNDLRVTMIDFIMDNNVENIYTYDELSEMSTDDLYIVATSNDYEIKYFGFN